MLGLTLAVFVAWPALYVWTKRRSFWRDWANATSTRAPQNHGPRGYGQIGAVLSRWQPTDLRPHEVWVYLVRDGITPAGRAAVLLAEGWRPGGTTVWGVTAPRLRYEYGLAWLTRLLRGAGPVYEIAVREKPGDPEGARALAHELAHHVWPHLHGEGMRRRDLKPLPNNPDNWRGHVKVKAGGQWTWEVEDRLLEGLGVKA